MEDDTDPFIESLFQDIPEPPREEVQPRGLLRQSGRQEEGVKDGHYCESCGNEVFRNGTRGRWPKYCTECKATRTGGTPKKASPIVKGRLNSIQQNLARFLSMVGIVTGKVAPTGGYVLVDRADTGAKAILELGKNNPTFLAAMEALGRTGPSVDVAEFCGAVVTAFAVDFGRVNPYGLLPQFLRVTEAYTATHVEGEAYAPQVVVPDDISGMPGIMDL